MITAIATARFSARARECASRLPGPAAKNYPNHARTVTVDRAVCLAAYRITGGGLSLILELEGGHVASQIANSLLPSYEHRAIVCGDGTRSTEETAVL